MLLIIRETVRFALLDTKSLSTSQECQNLETHVSGQIIVGHPKLVLLDQGVWGTLGMVTVPALAVKPPLFEPFKRGLGPNKYPVYKVYMGLIIKSRGPHPNGFSHHFPYEYAVIPATQQKPSATQGQVRTPPPWSNLQPPTWRIIPVTSSKWLITHGDRCCPLSCGTPDPNGLSLHFMAKIHGGPILQPQPPSQVGRTNLPTAISLGFPVARWRMVVFKPGAVKNGLQILQLQRPDRRAEVGE